MMILSMKIMARKRKMQKKELTGSFYTYTIRSEDGVTETIKYF